MLKADTNQILSSKDVMQKIKRIAFEIYENNFSETKVVLAGIVDNGALLAKLIKEELLEISSLDVLLIEISLDKKKPTQSEIELNVDINILQNKTIILVDDVQNTGRTFAYSLKPFLNIRIKKIQTAVLVNRDHKNFPISADYIGYALSTTLKEHITVELKDKKKIGVYLN